MANPKWRVWKDDLRAWGARLARAYGDRVLGVIWKQEFQQRGVVHFHLTVFFHEGREPDYVEFSEWVARTWTEVAEPGDVAHFLHGSAVTPVYNTAGTGMRRLMAYLSKYMAKSFDHDEPTGRIWGHWGEIPTRVYGETFLRWRDVVILCRRLRRWGAGSKFVSRLNGGWRGFLVMYDGQLLADLLLDLDA